MFNAASELRDATADRRQRQYAVLVNVKYKTLIDSMYQGS